MKKYILLLCIVIIIVSIIGYIYSRYQIQQKDYMNHNKYYENYYEKEITANDLASIINKALDYNETQKIEKDDNGNYKNNGKTSIIVEVKFKDSDDIFKTERISKLGINLFIKNYSNIYFKCTKKEYHENTNYIKYMLFEQI